MSSKLGKRLVLCGILCIVGAAGLFGIRQWQAREADSLCRKLTADFRELYPRTVFAEEAGMPDSLQDADAFAVLQVDGVDLVGILIFPENDLALPVAGSCNTDDRIPTLLEKGTIGSGLSIKGMDYRGQFGILNNMAPGDYVYFEDLWGILHTYIVTSKNVTAAKNADIAADMILYYRRSATSIYQVSLERVESNAID